MVRAPRRRASIDFKAGIGKARMDRKNHSSIESFCAQAVRISGDVLPAYSGRTGEQRQHTALTGAPPLICQPCGSERQKDQERWTGRNDLQFGVW